MKRIKIRALALLLSCSVLATGIVGGYEKVQAADLSAGAALAGESLSFLESLFMAGGMSLGLDMILKTQNDINNWDWGDVLDDPATQGQIDNTESKINEWYDNAVKDWYKNHGGSSKPTPTPGTSPPVTVAPINPDDLDIPEDWTTLKKNATDKGLLAMGAATAYCVKEAVKGWWDDIIESNAEISKEDNPFLYKDYIGYCEEVTDYNYTNIWGTTHYLETLTSYLYDPELIAPSLVRYDRSVGGHGYYLFYALKDTGHFQLYYHKVTKNLTNNTITEDKWIASKNNFTRNYGPHTGDDVNSIKQNYSFYVPIVDSDGKVLQEADKKPLGKTSLWPSVDLKDDYDNNRSPNFPELATPTLRLPSLDEIKDLWKQGKDDDDNRPTYVTNFITNHTVQTTPEPEPPDKPDAKPTPTIAVVPDPGGGSGSGGSGSGTNPDNPKPENPEDEVKPYTADLRDVFPFCIPFDLIHLFEVLDAEPEAPVFKIPIELKVDNPFTGKSIVDYEDTIKIDLSDYEQPIKVIRIFEVIFFLIGLMLITRSHMIKG